MKKLRSILCIVLALTMIIGGTPVSSYAQDAEENEAKEFKALCYNVAGLPDFNKLLGKGGNTLVLGLQDDAAVIKVFTKTGHRVGGGHRTTWFGDPMAKDLIFYIL